MYEVRFEKETVVVGARQQQPRKESLRMDHFKLAEVGHCSIASRETEDTTTMKAAKTISPDDYMLSPEERLEAASNIAREAFKHGFLKPLMSG